MSTKYFFVDTQERDELKKLQEQLNSVLETCRATISDISVHPSIQQFKEDVLRKLDSSGVFEVDSPDDEDLIIGNALRDRFSWRTDNGFIGLESVKRFLEQHPELSIADEYGETVSWTNFKKIAK